MEDEFRLGYTDLSIPTIHLTSMTKSIRLKKEKLGAIYLITQYQWPEIDTNMTNKL